MARLKSELVNGEWVNVPFTAEEESAADAMAIAAAPMEAEHEALRQREASFKADTDFIALLDKAKTASNAQINSWLATNVTTMAQARTVLGALIKIVAVRL